MARLFDVQIISGTAPGPYTIYYDTINVGNIVALTNSGNPATNVSFSSLSLGVNVTIPDNTTSIILFNEQCSIYETFIVPTPTPTPTPTSTPTPTPTATNTPTPTATNTPTPTPTPNCEFDVIVNNDTTPTPTPTPTNTPTPTPTSTPTDTPTPTPTPNCEFDVIVNNITTPTPTPTPTNTPTPTPTSTPTDTPTPTPTSTPTPTPTPTSTPTPTPTPTPNCEFDFDLSVNYSPTDILLTNNSINENNSINTIIGTLSTVTLDSSDTHTYSIVGGSSNFNISGNELRASVAFNYELTTSYNITIRTTDSVGQTYDKLFTIYINNVNEAPYGLSINNNSQQENTSIGTDIGTFTTLDVDAGDTFTYTLHDTSNFPDNDSFTLTSSGVLRNASVFNFESKTSYTIRVRTTDTGGLTYDGTFDIIVTNQNEPPTNINLSSSSISENVPTGTTIGTLSATDVDSGDTFTFTLVDSGTYPDNNSFYIDSTTLKSNTVFNFEDKNSYSIRVRVTDAGGLTFDKTITITITNVTIVVTASATTNVTCNGGSDGVITVSNATGGTASYTYSRDGVNYQVGTTFSSLTAGSYTIYAKDSYGEIGTTGVTVTQPSAITFSTTNTSPTCNGGTDGSIVVSGASGGSGTYTYSKDGTNYQAGTTFSSLSSGSYTIYVKDSNNCVVTNSVTLSRTAVTATVSQTNLTCFNGGNGAISITSVSGGQGGPYSTKLNVGGTYQVISTTRNYTSLSAGTYTVYVKDTAGCEVTYSITLTQPTELLVSGSANNPTCYDGTDGSITVSSSGGTGTRTHSISVDGVNYGSETTSTTFSNLGVGTYYLKVVDSNSCTAFSSGITLSKSAPNATISVTNVSCNGGSSASISVSSGTGGSGSGYQAKNGLGGTYTNLPATFSSLTAGSYTIYVRDGAGCVQTYNQTVTQPTAIGITVNSTTPPTCYNGSNGSIDISGSGGTTPYNYSINGVNYQSSGIFSSLPTGTYTLYVQDANECITSTSGTLSKSAPSATISATNPTCSSGTGTITVSSGTGGSGSGYQAKNGLGGTYTNLPATFSGLGGGSYVIYVRDGAGCEVTDSRTITIPSAVTVSLTSSTAPTCYNGGDGSISFSASGGNGSHQFRLNGGTWQPSGIFTGLSVGTYTIQTRDTNGCESSTTNVTLSKSAPTASVSQTNVSCNGGSNGSITVTSPSGGSGSGYTYSIDGVNYQSSGTFSSLPTSSYDIYVKDGAGCVSYLTSITITQPTAQSATITVNTFATCNGGADGAITLSSSGGTFPKTYRLYADTSAPYTTCGGDLVGTYNSVTSGSPSVSVTGIDEFGYCLEVTDNNGCVVNSGVVETTSCVGDCYTIEITPGSTSNNGEDLYIIYRKTDNTYVSQSYNLFLQDINGNNIVINVCSSLSVSFKYGSGGFEFIPDQFQIITTVNGKCDNSEWCGGADPYISPTPTSTPPPSGGGGYFCKADEFSPCIEQVEPCSGSQITCDEFLQPA